MDQTISTTDVLYYITEETIFKTVVRTYLVQSNGVTKEVISRTSNIKNGELTCKVTLEKVGFQMDYLVKYNQEDIPKLIQRVLSPLSNYEDIKDIINDKKLYKCEYSNSELREMLLKLETYFNSSATASLCYYLAIEGLYGLLWARNNIEKKNTVTTFFDNSCTFDSASMCCFDYILRTLNNKE